MEYTELTKSQKIAAFLVIIGAEAAAEVMRYFDDAQLDLICRDMSEMHVIDNNVRHHVLAEFCGVVAGAMTSVMGGPEFAQSALEKAKGNYAASVILDRVAPNARSIEGGEDIRKMETIQILNVIKTEQPQTIAFVLSHLDTAKAAEITRQLPQEQREVVLERLGAMEQTSRDIVGKIARNLGRHVDKRTAKQAMHRTGGVKSAAEILNAMDKETRNGLLARLDERNPELAVSIRKQVFGFDDLARLAPADLQRIVRDVDMGDLAKALKAAKPALASAFLGSVSKRAAEGLKEEMEMMGNLKAKDIEAAQDRIMQAVRKLEETEEITLEVGGEADAVS
jgi:flagellar motor switch protein FliG